MAYLGNYPTIGILGTGNIQDTAVTPAKLSTGAPTWNAAGNVGLGVTPSAWSTVTALQMDGPSMWGGPGVGHWTVNNYFDGTNYRYLTSNFATDYYQNNGNHVWRAAPSGTAGATFNFTQLMTLDVSGNLGINTPATDRLTVLGNVVLKSSSFLYSDAGGSTGQVRSGVYLDATNAVLALYTSSLERFRIDSGGRMLVPNQPAFYIYAGGLTGAIDSTIYITNGSLYLNKGGHYNTTNGRFTAPVAGMYTFTFFIARGPQAGSTPQFDIFLNGGSMARSLSYTTSYSGASVTVILQMAVGDYVNGAIIGSNGGTPEVYACGFSGHLIG